MTWMDLYGRPDRWMASTAGIDPAGGGAHVLARLTSRAPHY
jgi:hypothetical protein